MSALAAELVDSIVPFLCPAPPKRGHDGNNYLDKSTATHVGKCALISRGWVPASRRVLFYRVHVSQFTAHGFAKLFKRPERLTFLPFIRELEFRDGLVTHNWMNTVFPQIAKHLPSSISILVLNANHSGSPCSPAEHVCRSFSGVTQFELVGDWKLKFSDTLQCIASFPALEGLKVRLARDWDDRTPPEPSIRPAETLRSLNFGGHGMELLFDWIQESRIIVAELAVKFTFAPSLTSIQSTIQYIRSLGPSLTSLAVTFDDFWRPDSDLDAAFPADFLEANTRLRALYILAHPRQMVTLLKNVHLTSRMEVIRIAVSQQASISPPSSRPSTPIPQFLSALPTWSALDRMFEPLVSLRRLEIAHLAWTEFQANRLRARFNEKSAPMLIAFPLCVARGIVIQDVEGGDRRRWM